MTRTMAFAISATTASLFHSSSSSSSTGGKTPSLCISSNSAISIPRNAIFQHIKYIPQLGLTPFSQWNGLKNMGAPISPYLVKIERKGKCKGKGVYASLFGVGAPEVLVIGVVALLVFGPKGLAEVARNLGKTLREFQPTIRELQEVSREFKSSLEREIGLGDNPPPNSSSSNTTKPTPDGTSDDSGTNIEPSGSSSENVEDSTDDYVKLSADRFRGALAQLQKEQEEERREKEEKEKDQNQTEPKTPSQDAPQAIDNPQEAAASVTPLFPDAPQGIDTPQEAASVTPPSESPINYALQEAASVAPTGPTSKTEAQA